MHINILYHEIYRMVLSWYCYNYCIDAYHLNVCLVINCSFGYDVHAVLRQVGSLQRPCTAAQKGGLWKHRVSKTMRVHFMEKRQCRPVLKYAERVQFCSCRLLTTWQMKSLTMFQSKWSFEANYTDLFLMLTCINFGLLHRLKNHRFSTNTSTLCMDAWMWIFQKLYVSSAIWYHWFIVLM